MKLLTLDPVLMHRGNCTDNRQLQLDCRQVRKVYHAKNDYKDKILAPLFANQILFSGHRSVVCVKIASCSPPPTLLETAHDMAVATESCNSPLDISHR
jgi:hypothetical protein